MSDDNSVTLQHELSHLYEIHTHHNLNPPSEEEEYGNVRLSPKIVEFLQNEDEVKFFSAWSL